MARRPFICGNWKMNQDLAAVRAFFGALSQAAWPDHVDLGVAPVALHLVPAVEARGSGHIRLGTQDCHAEESGAHTGDLGAPMIRDAGGDFAIVGHSERRSNHGETSAQVAAKARAAVAAGLTALVCVGETLEERRAGRTLEVVSSQVRESLTDVPMDAVVIAYEPVWAIGTGEVATPEQAQEVHAAIRVLLAEMAGDDVASATRLLYGGSVKPANAAELLACPDIDGALVGGASLEAASLVAIADAAPALNTERKGSG